MFPDLQMTTIDPNDFKQPRGVQNNNYRDPKIHVWENVTFADNYYQTATTKNPQGRDIVNEIPEELLPKNSKIKENKADLSIHLGGKDNSESRSGFTLESKKNNPHTLTTAWYGGTTNLSWLENNPLGSPIHRRDGDFSNHQLFDPKFPDAKPWYEAYQTLGTNDKTEDTLQTEGVGNGWYYSVLGAGFNKREELLEVESVRTPLIFDNTVEARMRGDFAVPTIFNGNFDAITQKMDDQLIPGWSLHNGGSSVSASDIEDDEALQKYLVDWKDIPKLKNYRKRLGVDPNKPNYALKLGKGDKITHNRFVIPEWGSLRFNLFVPEGVEKGGGQIKVKLDPVGSGLDSLTKTILLEDVNFYTDTYGNSDINKDADRKLGYGSGNAATQGFETFVLDIPIESQLHNKSTTISFEVIGGSDKLEIYLDDVFIKSNHLRFGLPTPIDNDSKRKEARYSNASYSNNQYRDELLIERPQYALSYNGDTNTANWASWLVNKTWIFQPDDPILAGKRNFKPDTNLPNEFHQVRDADYIPAPVIEKQKYAQGHLVPVAHRNRPDTRYEEGKQEGEESKNNLAISLFSNIVPQEDTFNRGLWTTIENYANSFVKNKTKNYEVYVISGTHGIKKLNDGTDAEIPSAKPIKIPAYLWNVLLVLDSSNPVVDTNTYTVGFLTANRPATQEEKQWNKKRDSWKNSTIIHSVDFIEDFTGYDFFSNIPKDIQDVIEKNRRRVSGGKIPSDFVPDIGLLPERPPVLKPLVDIDLSANLMSSNVIQTETFLSSPHKRLDDSSIDEITGNTTVGHSGVVKSGSSKASIESPSQIRIAKIYSKQGSLQQFSIPQVSIDQQGTFEVGLVQSSAFEVSPSEVSRLSVSAIEFSTSQVNSTKVGSVQNGITKMSSLQIGPSEIGTSEIGTVQDASFTEVDISKVSPFKVGHVEASISEISTSKVGTPQIVGFLQHDSSKIPLSGGIALEQFFSSYLFPGTWILHNSTPEIINTFKDNPLNITIEATDLPTGQLAEAQVTHYTDQGIPNGGKILIDHNANGLGWFIDTTPFDHSEFSHTLTDTALLATADSEAHGKYDLLTTILHELGHLAGFISGYNEFDRHIQNINGKKTFVADNFTATLSPDGSHLDSEAHPYDLMNTTLRPGVRKLPSLLNLQILNALRSEGVREGVSEGLLTAPLTSDPLLGINNGTFDTQENWSTRGAANIIQGQAVLTEESRLNSSFTQNFIIPEEAKYLQFNILESSLTPSLPHSLTPNDAFEVALLNNQNLSLAGTAAGLTHTDALLNIQHDGDSYFSDKVNISGTETSGNQIDLNVTRTVTIDISHINANTEATLYFDLLGFGDKESRVVIDNVRILTDDILIPTANNDTAIANQGKPVTINVLDNDTDPDGTINPSTIQIESAPVNGNITINDDGTITYTPSGNATADTFTYTVKDNDNNTSNTATVNITINNSAPSIREVIVEPNLAEGIAATFSANAIDEGEVTYSWNFGDNTPTLNGQSVTHTFLDNGTYTAILTVTDSNGASTVETLTLNVNNIAPTVTAGDDQTTIENQAITFNGNYSDPGILDTHTIKWEFGDGTVVENELNPNYTYANPGTYTATLTVTDKDGGTSSDTLQVQVNNAAPTITEITGNTNLEEGAIAKLPTPVLLPSQDSFAILYKASSKELILAIPEQGVRHIRLICK